MTGTVKPLRVVAKLRNNRLIRAREDAGYPSALAAAKAMGVPPTVLCRFEALHPRQSPVFRAPRPPCGAGDWTPTALRISMFYKVSPDYLWPEELAQVTGTTSVVEIDVPQMYLEPPPTPDKALESGEMRAMVAAAMTSLTPVEQSIIGLRFGLDGEGEMKLDDVGARYGLSREGVRLAEQRALAKVKSFVDPCGCGHPWTRHKPGGCMMCGCRRSVKGTAP